MYENLIARLKRGLRYHDTMGCEISRMPTAHELEAAAALEAADAEIARLTRLPLNQPRFDDDQFAKIVAMRESGKSYGIIGRALKAPRSTVAGVCRRNYIEKGNPVKAPQ